MRLGFHLPVAGGLVRCAQQAQALGLQSLQIFAGNPRAWEQRPLDPAQASDFVRLSAQAGLRPVVVHAPYLLNLASPKAEIWERSIAALAQQMERARQLGAAGVVVHCGSRGQEELAWGLKRVAQGVGQALYAAGRGAACWLENTCGGGGQLGGSLEELAELLRLLGKRRVGVVLDTAHAWAAGHDLASAAATEGFLARVEETVGLKRVKAWHLNDSLHPLASRRDQHAHLGKGRLGGECFRVLVGHPGLAQAPGIMETPKDSAWADRRNLAFLRRLERGHKAKREI